MPTLCISIGYKLSHIDNFDFSLVVFIYSVFIFILKNNESIFVSNIAPGLQEKYIVNIVG